MSDFDPEAYASGGKAAAKEDGFDPAAYANPDTEQPELVAPEKPAPIASEDINAALKWVRANPNDPRAKRLLPKLTAMEASAKSRMGDRIMEGAKMTGADTATMGWGDEIANALGRPDKAKYLRETVDTFRKENPKTAMLASLAGGAPMLLAPNALPVALGASAVAGLGSSNKESLGDAAADTAIGAGVGGVGYGLGKGLAAGGQWLAGKAMENGGKALQLPQKAYEKLAEWLGTGSDSAAQASAKPSSRSALQQGLKGVASDAELAALGPEAGGAAAAAEKQVRAATGGVDRAANDILERPLSHLDGAQRKAVMEAVALGMQRRGLKVDAGAVDSAFDDLVRAAGKEPNEITTREAIRLVNQRDPAFAQRLAVNASEKWAPIRQGMDVDPREAQATELGQGMLDDIAGGKQNRFNVRGETGGVAQLPKDTPVPQMDAAERAGALARAKARDAAAAQARAAANPDNVLTNPSGRARGGVAMNEPTDTAVIDGAGQKAMKDARLAFQRSPAGQQRAQEIAAEVNDQVAARGVDPHTAGATPSVDDVGVLKKTAPESVARTAEPWNDFDGEAAQRLTGTADPALAGSAAKGRIRAINAGKERMGRYETVANVLGGGTPAMAKMAASDLVAGTGREAERIGANMSSPDTLARSWLKNPSLLAPLAQRQDKIGAGARFALDGLKEAGMDGLKARMFLLSMQPWFRAEIAASQQDEH